MNRAHGKRERQTKKQRKELLRQNRKTHKAVDESYDIAITNDLEDVDLALEVVKQLARQLLP